MYRYASVLLLSLASSALADITPFASLGCYQELSGSRLLSGPSKNDPLMTLDQCATFCSGYKYFGVQYKSECYCADAIPGATPTTQCNIKCGGNAAQICGGSGRLSVYKDATPPANSVNTICSVNTTATTDVTLVGSSYLDPVTKTIVLTNPVNNAVGAVWSNKLVKVTQDFQATFKFKLTHNPADTTPGCRTPANPKATADGVVFVVSPNNPRTAIGTGAMNIAYDFKNNFAVEFDDYQNSEFSDPAPFHIGVQSCGQNKNSGSHTGPCKVAAPVNITDQCFDNVEHTVVIKYAIATKTLTVYYDSVLYQTVTYDFTNLDLITGDRAYIGVTSSTGGQYSRQEVSLFDYECQVPAPTICSVDASSATATNQVNLVGTTVQDVNTPSFVLTQPVNNQAGAVWIKNAITVTTSFQVDFTFNLTHQPNTYTGCQSYYPRGQTADGIAFVISGDSNSKVGAIAQGIGYSGLSNNLAIEFDTWKNDGLFDTDFAHVGVQSCGKNENSVSHGPNGCAVVPPANFSTQCFDNVVHTASVIYDGVGNFVVKMDGVIVQTFTFNLQSKLALIGNTKAYIGITGSTGGQYSRQEVNFVAYPCS